MADPRKDVWSAYLLGTVATLIWSGQPVASALFFQRGFAPLDIVFVRYTVAGLAMLPLFVIRARRRQLALPWSRVLVLTALTGPIYMLVQVMAVSYAPPTHGSLIFPALVPVFVTVMVTAFDRGRGATAPAALALLLGGVVVAKWDVVAKFGTASDGAWRGDLLYALQALMWATYILLMKHWRVNSVESSIQVHVYSLLWSPLYLLLFAHPLEHASAGSIVAAGLYFGLAVSAFGSLLFNRAVTVIGAKTGLLSAIIPPFGIVLAATLHGDRLSPSLAWGTGLIFAGLVLAVRPPSTADAGTARRG